MAYREWLKIYRIFFFFTFDDDNKKNEFWWVQWRIPKDQTYPEVVRIYLFANRCKEVHTVTPDTLTLICFQMDVFDIKMHLLPLYMRKAEGPSRKCIKFNVASAKNDCASDTEDALTLSAWDSHFLLVVVWHYGLWTVSVYDGSVFAKSVIQNFGGLVVTWVIQIQPLFSQPPFSKVSKLPATHTVLSSSELLLDINRPISFTPILSLLTSIDVLIARPLSRIFRFVTIWMTRPILGPRPLPHLRRDHHNYLQSTPISSR